MTIEYEGINPLDSDAREKVIAMVEMTGGGGESGVTIESDGEMYRVTNWEYGTDMYRARGYGTTMVEALNAAWSYEETGDLGLIERLDDEWAARRKAIYSRA